MMKSMITTRTALKFKTVNRLPIIMSLNNYLPHFNNGNPIKLNTISNIRDLGGYRNASNQAIKPHRLIRSEKLFDLSPYDQRVLLKRYRLGVDIDLRNPGAVKRKPDVKMNGIRYVFAPVISDRLDYQNDLLNDVNGRLGKYTTYRQFIDTDQAKMAYRKLFLELLAVPDDMAVLFHCSEGKDRAGFATVLILKALGFSDDLIYHDYLLSNYYRRAANIKHLDSLRKSGVTKKRLSSAYYNDIVSTAYLDQSYHEAVKHYGSLKGYLIDGIGLDDSMISRLQNKYLSQ